MHLLQNKKFIVVAGKGGVGRTTTAFVLAQWAAAQQKKVLLCLAHSGSRYRHMLGENKRGDISEIAPNMFLLNIDPVAAREEYALKIIKNKLLHKLVFSNRYVNSFLDAVPGLSEWAMLGKATYHALDDAEEHERYDMVIFDSPPTGHGLDILRLPHAIAQGVQGGRMRQDALLRVALLKDASATAVIPVCLPEELPTNETIELSFELRRQGLPLFCVVINKVIDLLPREIGQYCDGLCPNEVKQMNWARPAVIRRNQRSEQLRHIQRLQETLPVPILQLPRLDNANLSEQDVQTLTAQFTAQLHLHCSR